MLDKNPSLITDGREAALRTPDRPLTVRDLLRFVRLRRYALLVPTGLALAFAYSYLQLAVPVYSARTQLIIDVRLPQFIPGHNEDTILTWDSAQVESEIAVLSSERIAGAVITKLGLDRDVDFRAPPAPLDRLRELIGLTKNEPVKKTDRFRQALDLIQGGLSVRRAGLSYAIDVTFSFPDAFRTSEVANAVAEAYIADQLENRSHAARVGGDWLQDRMVLLRSQMNAASQAVQIFRAGHNYTIPTKDNGGNASQPGSTKPEEKTLDELEATASTYRRIFESFLQSYTESVQRQSFPVSDARILTPASLPEVRSTPRGSLIYALAGLIGLLIGSGIGVFQHNTDRVVRLSHQISDLGVLENLGEIPRLRRKTLRFLRRGLRRRRSAKIRKLNLNIEHRLRFGSLPLPSRRSRYFVAALEAETPYGDPFFATKTLIDLARCRSDVRSIGVMAPHAGAGSSTIASNLGRLAAACGTRTLVIDADLQRRTLSRCIKPPGRLGLVEVLSGSAPAEDAIVRFGGTDLNFLPACGSFGADASPLTQDALEHLLVQLRDMYTLIIVDLPPLFPIGDGLGLSAALDGITVVVESGKTTLDLVQRSAEYLTRVHASTLGFILNKSA